MNWFIDRPKPLSAVSATEKPRHTKLTDVRVTLSDVSMTQLDEFIRLFQVKSGWGQIEITATLAEGGTAHLKLNPSKPEQDLQAEVHEWAAQYSTPEAVGDALKEVRETG